MEKIGVDVRKVATQVCVLTEAGEYEECRISHRARHAQGVHPFER